MKTKVKLEGMQFYAFHGYYKEEQKIGSQFELDAEIVVKTFDEFEDQIDDTVNYEKIYNICKEEMEITQQLIETVAIRILKKIQSLKNVVSAEIRIAKLHPKMGGIIDAAVVEMSI